MTTDELKEICALVVELTKLRQAECKHLVIENFAPELLGKLLREHRDGRTTPPFVPLSAEDVERLSPRDLIFMADQAFTALKMKRPRNCPTAKECKRLLMYGTY